MSRKKHQNSQDRRKRGEPSQRQLRVGEEVRHALCDLLLRVEIDDKELKESHVTISEVRMSGDLRLATIFASPLGGGRGKEMASALNRNSRFIRKELAPRLTLKYMPELLFKPDPVFDQYEHIDQLLHSPKVARDLD